MQKELEMTVKQCLKETEGQERKHTKEINKRKDGTFVSMHFFTLLISTSTLPLIFLLCSLPPIAAHHFVFEEIREMVGALSYILAIVLFIISGLYHTIQNY
jgi:hypothetical protein